MTTIDVFNVSGCWQHINWQFIEDPQNLEKFKRSDIESRPPPVPQEKDGENITKVFIFSINCSFIEQTL